MARTPSATRYHLELEGQPCGFVRSVEGGSMRAEVVTEAPGSEHFLKKHLGSVAVEPIVLTFGLGLAPVVYEWMAEALDGGLTSRSGAIAFADPQLARQRTLTFEHAVVAAVTIPAHDGASKDASFFTLALQPERTELRKASGRLAVPPAAKAKQWVAANFRLEIDELDTSRVAKVDALRIETTAEHAAGEGRLPRSAPKIDFPDLRVRLAEAGADSWLAWHEDFVVKGNCDDAHERAGALVVLGPSLEGELLRLELEGLGIWRLAPRKLAAAADAVRFLDAALYCERMRLEA